MACDAALVGARGTSSGSSVTTTAGTTSASGSSFALLVSWDGTVSISGTITDSKGNTYTAVGTPQADWTSTWGVSQWFYCQGGTGGTSHSVTVNFTGTAFPVAHLIEVTSANGAPVYDSAAAAQTQDAASPYTVTSGTLTNATSVVLSGCGANRGADGAYSSSNFTVLSQEPAVSSFWTSGAAKLVVSSTSAVTPSWTVLNRSETAGVTVIAFREPAGGTAIGQPSETDTAQPMAVVGATPIGQVTETDTALALAPAGPAITSASTATPANGATLTISGSGFGGSQGTQEVRIGGVVQPISSWAAGSIVVSGVLRGANKYGVAVNVEIWNSGSLSSNSFALTGLTPQSGWSYVNLATPNTTAANRLRTSPDLASGDQVAYDNVGGLVTVADDATFSAGTSVTSFDFEVWSSPEGWGGAATQYIVTTESTSRGQYAARVVTASRRRGASLHLLSPSNWGAVPLSVEKWFAPELTAAVGGGGPIAIGQATEADSAQPFTSRQTRAIGQVTETDLAQPVTARRTLAIGQPAETDTAQAFARSQAKAIGQVAESDSALAAVGLQRLAIGQPAETDSALTATVGSNTTLGQAVEADTAQAVTALRTQAAGIASETDSAQPITQRQTRALGQALEIDSALAATIFVAGVLGQPAETDTAQAMASAQRLAAGIAAETDTAQAVTVLRTLAAGIAVETDTAQAMLARQSRAAGQAVETDIAQPVSASLPGTMGQALEVDLAQPAQARQTKAMGLATEADSAFTMALGGTSAAVGIATEADSAQAFVSRLLLQVGQAIEVDTALPATVRMARSIGTASEVDQAFAAAQRQLAAIGIAVEFDSAQLFTYPGYGDDLSAFWRYEVPGLSLAYDVPAAALRYEVPSEALRFDVPSIGAGITIT